MVTFKGARRHDTFRADSVIPAIQKKCLEEEAEKVIGESHCMSTAGRDRK